MLPERRDSFTVGHPRRAGNEIGFGYAVPMLARNDWVASGRSMEFGASSSPHRIFVREAGSRDAPPILLLHGFPSSSWDYAKLEPLLVDRFRLGYLDFLGHGASSKPAHYRYSLMEQAHIAIAALGELGFDRFHVVAHDYGASVAQQFLCEPALRGRIAGVTFLNGSLYATAADRSALEQPLLRSALGPLASWFISRERFTTALARLFSERHPPTASDLDQQWAAFEEGDGSLRTHRIVRSFDDRLAFGAMWESALEQTDVPLNFVWGMCDPIAGPDALERIVRGRASLPNLTTFPDAGHYPHLEVPERVAASIDAFAYATRGLRSP
jgi:pimeloyl-ACP methyl ester carboxylesterase